MRLIFFSSTFFLPSPSLLSCIPSSPKPKTENKKLKRIVFIVWHSISHSDIVVCGINWKENSSLRSIRSDEWMHEKEKRQKKWKDVKGNRFITSLNRSYAVRIAITANIWGLQKIYCVVQMSIRRYFINRSQFHLAIIHCT